MSDTTAPAATAPKRASLVLAKPIKNSLPGSTLVQAKRSPQVHVLPAGATRTLCAIDVGKSDRAGRRRRRREGQLRALRDVLEVGREHDGRSEVASSDPPESGSQRRRRGQQSPRERRR